MENPEMRAGFVDRCLPPRRDAGRFAKKISGGFELLENRGIP
jgi:hypothetical protein